MVSETFLFVDGLPPGEAELIVLVHEFIVKSFHFPWNLLYTLNYIQTGGVIVDLVQRLGLVKVERGIDFSSLLLFCALLRVRTSRFLNSLSLLLRFKTLGPRYALNPRGVIPTDL